MTLPGSEHAVVDVAKVRDYLLSHEHPVGRSRPYSLRPWDIHAPGGRACSAIFWTWAGLAPWLRASPASSVVSTRSVVRSEGHLGAVPRW
jgi:hypothetical protein